MSLMSNAEPERIQALFLRRRALYEELLACSRRQLELLDKWTDEQFQDLFSRLVTQWSVLAHEIEAVQHQLNGQVLPGQVEPDEALVQVMQAINVNVEQSQAKIRAAESGIDSDRAELRNQHKIMNAYYGAHRSDSAALYIDEKQ